jgi:protein-tyrosine phosphatase
MPSTILFICTGNYYRSRFAEYWFNHLTHRYGGEWSAQSAGLRPDYEQKHNLGPLSSDALAALKARNVQLPDPLPMPRALTADLLDQAYRTVALDRSEHRPMMLEQFPIRAQRITYWDIRDVPPGPLYDPMADIDAKVRDLLAALAEEPAPAWKR